VPVAQSEFDDFCRFAFAFLDDRGTRYLVVGGLAVMVVGEPRTRDRSRACGSAIDHPFFRSPNPLV
jgi:hypothetical protein